MNSIFIPMTPDNVDKIISGKKTTTIRSKRASEQIGLFVKETAVAEFKGIQFYVTNKGPLTIEEAGGKEIMMKAEGFKNEKDFLFKQTSDWLDGKGRLYVYEFKKIEDGD